MENSVSLAIRQSLSNEELLFTESLILDLRPLGYSLFKENGVIVCHQRVLSPAADYRDFFRSAHTKIHLGRVQQSMKEVTAFEKQFGESVFIEGLALNIGTINPRLRPVNLRHSATAIRDRLLIDYIRTYQTVGSRKSVGRENCYILEDLGQTNAPVMGVLVLASPRYYQGRRDEVFGWHSPTQLRDFARSERARHESIRLDGLNRIMHIAICCALPPYSHLGAARLLAVAPFTRIVADDFVGRWKNHEHQDPDLAMITTTTSMGTTGTPFQNLRRGKFVDQANAGILGDNWNPDGELYCRLGETHPWRRREPIRSAEIFADFRPLLSKETFKRARKLVGKSEAAHLSDPQVLYRVLRRIGLGQELLRGNPMGVFIGAIDRQAVEAVASGAPRSVRPVLDWNLAVQQFRSDFGEADDPTKKPGMKIEQRAAAIQKRRARALGVCLADILLSQRSRSLTKCEPFVDNE